MSGSNTVTVGDRGRIVLPADLRKRAGLSVGTPLVVVETPGGLVLLTREQLHARVRDDLDGTDLVSELVTDRRAAAAVEDAR
jgi:AbrB family looped-hinge helix DNA binding protein